MTDLRKRMLEELERRNYAPSRTCAYLDFDLPEGTFFDCAFVHHLTTATLDRLRVLYAH